MLCKPIVLYQKVNLIEVGWYGMYWIPLALTMGQVTGSCTCAIQPSRSI